MELNLNRQSGVPLYRQVKNLILEKVRTGELSSGYKMPTERELSDMMNRLFIRGCNIMISVAKCKKSDASLPA